MTKEIMGTTVTASAEIITDENVKSPTVIITTNTKSTDEYFNGLDGVKDILRAERRAEGLGIIASIGTVIGMSIYGIREIKQGEVSKGIVTLLAASLLSRTVELQMENYDRAQEAEKSFGNAVKSTK